MNKLILLTMCTLAVFANKDVEDGAEKDDFYDAVDGKCEGDYNKKDYESFENGGYGEVVKCPSKNEKGTANGGKTNYTFHEGDQKCMLSCKIGFSIIGVFLTICCTAYCCMIGKVIAT